MSKGGGSGNNSTVTSQTTPNPIAQGAYQTAVNTGTSVAQQPYPVYNGSLVAGFTPEQQAAFGNINSASGLAQPYYEQAAKLIQASTSGVDPASTVGSYTNSNLASQYTDPARQLAATSGQGINPLSGQFGVQNFMNPYNQSVVSSMQALQKQQDASQQEQLIGQAAGAGAFGGDRAAIAQSTLAGQQDLANNASLANVLQSGYGQALGAAEQTGTTNAQLGLGAGQLYGSLGGLNQGAYNTALQTGLGSQEANAWLASQGAFGMSNLGTTVQNSALTGANAQLQAGGLQQQLAQEQLNVPYQQFQQAQAYPFQTTNFELGLATGNPGGGSSSTTSPGPSTASQLTGLGLTGLGLYNAYNNSGGFGNLFGSSGASTGAIAPTASDTGWLDTTGLGTGATDTGWYTPPVARGGRIGYDDGGAVTAPLGLGANMPTGGLPAATEAGLGSGNPMLTGQLQQLNNLPTEKLHELQMRMPPGSPQGNLVAMTLRRRMMMPQSNPAMAGLGTVPTMPGMAAGGGVDDTFDPDADPTIGRMLYTGSLFPNLNDWAESRWAAQALAHPPPSRAGPWAEGATPAPGANTFPPPPPAQYAPERPPILRALDWARGLSVGRGPSGELGVWSPGQMPPPDEQPPLAGHAPPPGLPIQEGSGLGGSHPVVDAPLDLSRPGVAGLVSPYDERPTHEGIGGAGLGSLPPSVAPAPAPVRRGLGTQFHGPGMMPPPPAQAPPPDVHPAGEPTPVQHENGLGAEPSFLDRATSGTSGALIAAGLGIMGGQSPFALTNIGQGAMHGLDWAQNQKLRQQQAQYNFLKEQELADYHRSMAANSANRNDSYAQLAAARSAHENAAATHALAGAIGRGSEERFMPYGEDDNGNAILVGSHGTMRTVPLPDGASGFREQGIVNRQSAATDKIDLARQTLELQKQKYGRDLTNAEVNQTLRLYGVSKDMMGKPTVTLPQAQSTVRGLRGDAAPAGGTLPTFATPADVAKAGLKSGDHFLDSAGVERMVP